MSRRVSRIHITVVTMKISPPSAEIIQLIVVPTTIPVIAAADTNGIRLGPGRWISSPKGGVWSESLRSERRWRAR